MKALAWNLLVALLWVLLSGNQSAPNFLLGFALGFFALLLAPGDTPPPKYLTRAPRAIVFAVFLIGDASLSALRVALDILTPRYRARPGTIAVPLEPMSDFEMTLLVALVTLTPGTMAIDVSADRRTLYVHDMYIWDPDHVRRRVKQRYERRVLGLFR